MGFPPLLHLLPSVSRIVEVLILSKITLSLLAEPTLNSLTPTNGAAIGKIGMVHFGISELFTGSALSMK